MNFRKAVLQSMGDFPKKPDTDFEVANSEQRDGYTLQTVRYNVEPGERISAFLLIPDRLKKKNPAVLAIHQHRLEYLIGKSEVIGAAGDPMYAYGLELCKRGYVALVPDLLCFEERRKPGFAQRPDDIRKYEMYEFARLLQSGSSLRAKYLHDHGIAVDILESLPYVDKNRIGVVGHSLGGQEAAWMMWFDKCIAAAVCSCGIGQTRAIFRDNNLIALSLYIPGFAKIGDSSDMVCEIAPRPFFMTNGRKDTLFPLDGVQEIIDKAVARYSELGKPENYRAVIFDGGHLFADDEKRAAYAWLDDILENH